MTDLLAAKENTTMDMENSVKITFGVIQTQKRMKAGQFTTTA